MEVHGAAVKGRLVVVSCFFVTEIFSSNPVDTTKQFIVSYPLKYALGLQTALKAVCKDQNNRKQTNKGRPEENEERSKAIIFVSRRGCPCS